MGSGWKVAMLLLLLTAGAEAQSGDGDGDEELRISCSSDITTHECGLTCRLVPYDAEDAEDEEDEEEGGIEGMTLCYSDLTDASPSKVKCLNGSGDTIRSKDLSLLSDLKVTVHLKRGGQVSQRVDMMKIVKPRCPQVWNVTLDQDQNQALIRIRTPYHKDYLTLENQLFQLHISTTGRDMVQNISSGDVLHMDMDHLQRNSRYHVRVRAIPQTFFKGTWSEWSDTFTFYTPTLKTEDSPEPMVVVVVVCLVSVVVVTSSAVIFWKNKIFTYVWPSIPHPKQTLVQICKPNKGLLLNFKPEVFSSLNVYPLEKTNPVSAPPSAPPISAQSSAHSSAHSSDCSSATTEELELSALLSQSSDGEEGLRSAGSAPQIQESPVPPRPTGGTTGNEGGPQEEAYVTMSSFYQIK